MGAGHVQRGAQQPGPQSAGLGQPDPIPVRPRPGEHLRGQVRRVLLADPTDQQPVHRVGVPVVQGVECGQVTEERRSPQSSVGVRIRQVGGGVSHGQPPGQGQGWAHTYTSAPTLQRCTLAPGVVRRPGTRSSRPKRIRARRRPCRDGGATAEPPGPRIRRPRPARCTVVASSPVPSPARNPTPHHPHPLIRGRSVSAAVIYVTTSGVGVRVHPVVHPLSGLRHGCRPVSAGRGRGPSGRVRGGWTVGACAGRR